MASAEGKNVPLNARGKRARNARYASKSGEHNLPEVLKTQQNQSLSAECAGFVCENTPSTPPNARNARPGGGTPPPPMGLQAVIATPLPPQNFSQKPKRPKTRKFNGQYRSTPTSRYQSRAVHCAWCSRKMFVWRREANRKKNWHCSPEHATLHAHALIPGTAIALARRIARSQRPKGRPRRPGPTRWAALMQHPKYAEWRKRSKQREAALNFLKSALDMTRKAGIVAVTPQTTARIRSQIATGLVHYIRMADEVLHGSREWTPTQARVFSMLLNKVVPDLSASFVQHEHKTANLRELSREELERIAAGEDAITVEYADADHKSRETAPLLEHEPAPVRPGDEPARPRRGRPRKQR